ncbi:nitrate- and nitrite sensing domain-containing protein [Luedemannella flava]
MIINRLRVRGKLNLLLLLPVVAVVLIAVPFVSSQIGNAASAVTTADAANNARQLGALVWDLQRERLITAGYLAAPGADPVRLRLAQQTTSDTVVRLRDGLGATASDEMVEALARVGSLNEIRQGALMRGASVDSVARTYHAVIEAIIDALRLVPQRTSDAEGTRQLTALDALLQANEENELRGMALIAAAVSPGTGVALLDNATEQAAMFTERFVEQADAEQAGLVVLVDQGETARQVDDLAEHLPAATDRPAVGRFVAAALSSVSAQSDLRRMVQDRVTRQIADTAAARADAATGLAWAVGLGTAALVAVVVGLLVAVTRSIATPLRRLTTAAATVADLAQAELVRVNDAEEADEQPRRPSRSTSRPATSWATWPPRSTGSRPPPRSSWSGRSSPGATSARCSPTSRNARATSSASSSTSSTSWNATNRTPNCSAGSTGSTTCRPGCGATPRTSWSWPAPAPTPGSWARRRWPPCSAWRSPRSRSSSGSGSPSSTT